VPGSRTGLGNPVGRTCGCGAKTLRDKFLKFHVKIAAKSAATSNGHCHVFAIFPEKPETFYGILEILFSAPS